MVPSSYFRKAKNYFDRLIIQSFAFIERKILCFDTIFEA